MEKRTSTIFCLFFVALLICSYAAFAACVGGGCGTAGKSGVGAPEYEVSSSGEIKKTAGDSSSAEIESSDGGYAVDVTPSWVRDSSSGSSGGTSGTGGSSGGSSSGSSGTLTCDGQCKYSYEDNYLGYKCSASSPGDDWAKLYKSSSHTGSGVDSAGKTIAASPCKIGECWCNFKAGTSDSGSSGSGSSKAPADRDTGFSSTHVLNLEAKQAGTNYASFEATVKNNLDSKYVPGKIYLWRADDAGKCFTEDTREGISDDDFANKDYGGNTSEDTILDDYYGKQITGKSNFPVNVWKNIVTAASVSTIKKGGICPKSTGSSLSKIRLPSSDGWVTYCVGIDKSGSDDDCKLGHVRADEEAWGKTTFYVKDGEITEPSEEDEPDQESGLKFVKIHYGSEFGESDKLDDKVYNYTSSTSFQLELDNINESKGLYLFAQKGDSKLTCKSLAEDLGSQLTELKEIATAAEKDDDKDKTWTPWWKELKEGGESAWEKMKEGDVAEGLGIGAGTVIGEALVGIGDFGKGVYKTVAVAGKKAYTRVTEDKPDTSIVSAPEDSGKYSTIDLGKISSSGAGDTFEIPGEISTDILYIIPTSELDGKDRWEISKINDTSAGELAGNYSFTACQFNASKTTVTVSGSDDQTINFGVSGACADCSTVTQCLACIDLQRFIPGVFKTASSEGSSGDSGAGSEN